MLARRCLVLLLFGFAAAGFAENCPTTLSVSTPPGEAILHIEVNPTCDAWWYNYTVDGNGVSNITCYTTPCVADVHISTLCWTPGSQHTARASSTCGMLVNGQCYFSQGSAPDVTFTVPDPPTPSVSLEYDKDHQQLHITYDYTPAGGGWLSVLVDGQQYAPGSIWPDECTKQKSDQCYLGMPFACLSGPHHIVVTMQSCQYLPSSATTRTLDVKASDECANQDASVCKDCKDGPSAPTSVSNPINIGSGDVIMTVPLFTIAQDPLPMRFDLHYHSLEQTAPWAPPGTTAPVLPRPFGWSPVASTGWTHTFNQTMTKTAPYRLRWITETGDRYFFDALDDQTFSAAIPSTSRDFITIVGTEYVLHHLDGSTARFDIATGLWRSTTDRWGNTISGTYDGANNLTQLTDAVGRTVLLAYSGSLLTSIQLPDGALWRFGYNNGALVQVFDPLHAGTTPWRQFAGQTQGFVGAISDDANAVLEAHTYDCPPNGYYHGVASWVGSQRQWMSLAYTSATQTAVTERIDGVDHVRTFTFATIGGKTSPTNIDGACTTCGTGTHEAFVYAPTGEVTSRTDATAHTTTYSYDGNSNLLSTTAAPGTLLERTTTYAYENPAWPNQRTKTTETSTISGTKVTQATWNTGETVLTATETGQTGNGSATFTRTQTYDAQHRLVGTDGPRTDVNDTTAITYYPDNDPSVNRRGRIATLANALGQTTTFDNYDLYGTARDVTDPNGVTTHRETDARGRITSQTVRAVTGDPNESTDYTTTWTYDSRDRLVQFQTPRGTITKYVYEDGSNWLTDTVRVNTAGQEVERRHLTYNSVGKKTKEEDQACATPATPCASWVTKRSESFVYDDNGRLTQQQHPDSTLIKYAYDDDGRLLSVQDERHTTANTSYQYDELARLSSVTQTLGTGSIVTSYGYDVQDNLVRVTDPNNNVTTYAYDDFRRLTQQTSPVSGTTTYSYDPAGNLLMTTDANSASTTRTYDSLNRATSAVSTRSGNTETVSWTYDDATTGHYGIGRLATLTDPTGSTVYQYERRGQLRSEVKTINAAPYTTSYIYDANGNRSQITYPSGLVAQYTFDMGDRPYSLTAGGTSIVSSATYLPFGPLASLAFGNGTTRTMQYDNQYRPQENKLVGPAGTLADYTYQKDNAGNITQIDDVSSGDDRYFGYDDLNRLTTANGGSGLWGTGTYSYDAMGNMTSSTLGSWKQTTATRIGTTPKLSSMLENGTARSVTYDNVGNELTAGTSTFTYSPRNQLVTADTASYVYDGRGVLTISSAPALLLAAPARIKGGGSGTATVTIGGVLTTDTLIALSSSDPSATVPATVTVPAGTTSANFTITTTTVPTDTAATITATGNGGAKSWNVTVLAPQLASFTVSPTSARAGDPVTATVTLRQPADGAKTVAISGGLVGAPINLVIPQSSTTGTATVIATRLGTVFPEGRALSATLEGETLTTQLAVYPPVIASFGVTPTNITGGTATTGQVTLTGTAEFAPTGGVNVQVTSTNPSLAGVPGATMTVPGSSITGTTPVLTAPVLATSAVVITAATGNVSQSAPVTIQPLPVTIASFSVSPTSITATNPVTGTVTLTAPAPAGGLDIELTANTTAVSPAIPFVHVAEGSSSATFQINTLAVSTTTAATITASHSATSKSAVLTVSPPSRNAYLAALVVTWGWTTPNGGATTGGNSMTLQVRLGGGTGRASVSLASSNTALVTVPKSVTVDNGATSADFTITTVAVATATTVKVSATYNGTEQDLFVTLMPPNAVTIQSLTGVTQLQGSQSLSRIIMLTGNAPAGGAVVTIGGSRPGFVMVDQTVTIPAGTNYGWVQFTSSAFLGPTHAMDLTATYQGVTQKERIAILPVTLSAANHRREPIQCAALSIAPCLTAATLHAATTAVGDPGRYYLYTPELQLLAETEHSASASKPIAYSYLWFGGQPVAQIDSTNTTRWTMVDHLGTPFLQTNSTGSVVWRAELTPYGELFTTRTGSTVHQPLRLPGQFLTDASASHYNIFRWYRAGWGQYTQPDPIGLIADKNLYRYAASAPANVTDRFGLWPTTPLKCCYYMYKCSSEGTDCSNKLKTKLGSMDEEEKYELFVAGGVATESDYLKKKCFDSNPNCKAMIIECGKEAAKPFPYFTKDSANSDPLPMSPKPWWKFWN